MGRKIYETYKGKQIMYEEVDNTWTVEGYDDEDLSSLKSAREYIDKIIKGSFTRIRALAEGYMGTVTSVSADGRKVWFTPDKRNDGRYDPGRRMEHVDDVFPEKENKELVDQWLALKTKIDDLEILKEQLEREQRETKEKMKSYAALNPDTTVGRNW